MLNEQQLQKMYSEPVEVLRMQLKEQERIFRNYQHEHGKLQLFFEDLKSIITPIEPPSVIFKKESDNAKYHVVMQISDTHMGAVQELSEIEGFNEYNPDVCCYRSIEFAKRVVEWVRRKRTAYDINSISVLVTGDLVSGDIHDELKITNAFPVTIQCVKAAELLAKQISILTPHFEQVTVEYIGADNHGRLTKKPQAKEEGINSYNYLVGYMSSLHLQRFSNVEFNIYPVHEKVVNAGGRQYLLCHGHGIQGWMGIPWYSIERKQNREARARMQLIMESTDNEYRMMKEIGFHKFVFAHYHYPINTPHYSGNGSTQGTDAYDHKNGRHADPSQSAWLVHPKYGEFDRIDFNLKYLNI